MLKTARLARPETWLPAAFMALLGVPAMMGAVGTSALLDQEMRGAAMLLVPAGLAWWTWEERHCLLQDGLDPMVKLFGGSWLVGTALGAAIWQAKEAITSWLV